MTDGTAGPWRVQRIENAAYPDLPTFNVMAPNPDAGKEGVSYAGKEFMVAHSLDSEADARLIAEAPAMLEALRHLFEHCAMVHKVWGDGSNQREADAAIEAGRAVLARLEQP